MCSFGVMPSMLHKDPFPKHKMLQYIHPSIYPSLQSQHSHYDHDTASVILHYKSCHATGLPKPSTGFLLIRKVQGHSRRKKGG